MITWLGVRGCGLCEARFRREKLLCPRWTSFCAMSLALYDVAACEVKQQPDNKLGIDALHECLERIDPSLTKYANEMHAADIHPDQIPHLNFLHLQAIGVTVGDAIRITSATGAPGGSAKRREEEEDLTAGREGEEAASREEEEDTRGRDREQDALNA